MPIFTSTSNEFMVPLDYHKEVCDLAEGRFREGEQPFDVTMALQDVPSPEGLSVRYRTGRHMVHLFRTLKDAPEEAGPSEDAALLKIETAQPLPVTDRWSNAYVAETFTAGLVHPRFQHFEHALWRYDLGVEHRYPDGMMCPDPDQEALFNEQVDLESILSQSDSDKIFADLGKIIFEPDPSYGRLALAALNEAYELFPHILRQYQHRDTIERLRSAQSLLNAADLTEIGCEPNPYIRTSE